MDQAADEGSGQDDKGAKASPQSLRQRWDDFYRRDWNRILGNVFKQVGWAIGSIILALLIGALIIVATGRNPAVAYEALLRGSVLNGDQVLFWATPLTLTGLSVALAFRCGLFNIGAEGQLLVGSLAGTIVGFVVALPVLIHPIACLVVGTVAGALWALVPGLLKAYRGAHEVVTTMMLSYTAVYFTQWLVSFPLKQPGQMHSQTPPILVTAWLPKIGGSHFLHFGFFIAILCAIGVYIFLNKTVLGYKIRAVGKNPAAAETAGISSKKMTVLALTMSGGLAGLAGIGEILGFYHRYMDAWSGGLGFDGITVAVLGANSPLGVIFAALFFGFLRAGSLTMQTRASVPTEMIDAVQGLVVLFVAAPKVIDWLARKNVSYAKWMTKAPRKAVPIFLAANLALVGTIIGLAVGFASINVNPMITLSLVTVALVGLAGFVETLRMKRWGPVIAAIVGASWLAVGPCNLVFQGGTLIIPLLVLGILAVLLSAYSFYLIARKGVVMEVKP